MSFKLVNDRNGKEKEFESRSEAEDKKKDMISLGVDSSDLEIVATTGADNSAKADGGAEVIETEPADPVPEDAQEETEQALEQLGESIENDPLDVLPGYMITTVDGKPSLNKRGVSVLAYHYDIDVQEHDVIAYPHETDFESAIVTITVTGSDGRTFSGSGEAHSDETAKHQLLRMAETRAYKRAVIFATGTGIVGYQELMSELQ